MLYDFKFALNLIVLVFVLPALVFGFSLDFLMTFLDSSLAKDVVFSAIVVLFGFLFIKVTQ
jgi:hypothetical protein